MLIEKLNIGSLKIAVLGLGYVGLPLSIAFSEKFNVTGYDIDAAKVNKLNKTDFHANPSSVEVKRGGTMPTFTNDQKELAGSDIFIITVPTPIDKFKRPNLSMIEGATRLISKYLTKGNIVIYESTVYPGTTEEICVPIIEECSGLIFKEDFFAGYSPERLSPGTKMETISEIIKLVSGCTEYSVNIIEKLYSEIIHAGTFRCSSIKVAEASKVLENIQRDVNIGLINEATKIFSAIGVPVYDVLEAARTKWNFLDFSPGLVGGHCIGIDPYYLAHKAIEYDISPQVIMASRASNEGMIDFITSKICGLCHTIGIPQTDCNVLIAGFTFKQDCPDFRNTKIPRIISDLNFHGMKTSVYDPIIDLAVASKDYPNVNFLYDLKNKKFDIIALLVPHEELFEDNLKMLRKCLNENGILFDFKNVCKLTDPKVVTI